MVDPSVWRSFESSDCTIRVRTLPGGDFLVKLQAGPISIRTTIPPAQIGFLFPAQGQAA